MGSNFLSLPAKRPIQYLSTSVTTAAVMPDNAAANGSSNKRSKPPQPPLTVQPGRVVFRLLCNVSRVGGVIGKSGSAIKKIQEEIGAKIRIEDAPSDCNDRVITVIGPSAIDSKVSTGIVKEEEVEVSKGQQALIRVFERILEVAAESDGLGLAASGAVVSCRLLTSKKEVGSVIGKGGKNVERMKRECGCKIRALMDNLPACAEPSDEMIEIEGNVAAVKQGLVAVSRCLQDCQPVDKTRMVGGAPVGAVVQESFAEKTLSYASGANPLLLESERIPSVQNSSLRYASGPKPLFLEPERVSTAQNGYANYASGPKPLFLESERVPHMLSDSHSYVSGANPFLLESERAPTIPNSSLSYASGARPYFSDTEQLPSRDTKSPQQQVIFRILCSNDRIGGIIGKGGGIIRATQNETGASINIGAAIADCGERLITISATEIPELQYSAAQKAVLMVFSNSAEAGSGKGLNSGSNKGAQIAARLVISPRQVGAILGKGGSIVSELRKATGANIRILGTDQVPKCVPENDQVVQISGDLTNIKDALYDVTGKLRNFLFSGTSSLTGTKSTPLTVPDIDPYGSLGGAPREPLRYTFRDPLRDTFREPLRETLRDPLRNTWKDPLKDPSLWETWKDQQRDASRDPNLLSGGVSRDFGRHAAVTQNMDRHGISSGLDCPPSPKHWESQTMTQASSRGFTDNMGLSSFKGGLEFGRFGAHTSGTKSAFVTNTTVEIVVPESIVGSVFGDNGNNLARLRQISGAKVIFHEPRLGSSDRIIVISGTPDETQAAQSLLQAFILTGQS